MTRFSSPAGVSESSAAPSTWRMSSAAEPAVTAAPPVPPNGLATSRVAGLPGAAELDTGVRLIERFASCPALTRSAASTGLMVASDGGTSSRRVASTVR